MYDIDIDVVKTTRRNDSFGFVLFPAGGDGIDWSQGPFYPLELYRYRGDNPDYIADEVENLCAKQKLYTSNFVSFYDERELKPEIYPESALSIAKVIEACHYLDGDWVFPNMHLRDLSQDLGVPYLKLKRILKHDNYVSHVALCRKLAARRLGSMREGLRCASFSKTFKSTMMWERYSSFGRGVCFKLSYNEQKALSKTERSLKDIYLLKDGTVEILPETKIERSPSYLAAMLSYLIHSGFNDISYVDVLPEVTDLDICIGNISHESRYVREAIYHYMSDDHHRKLMYTKSHDYNGDIYIRSLTLMRLFLPMISI